MGLTRTARPLAAVLLALALFAPTASADDPIVWRTDYAAARKEAAEKKRPLLILVCNADCVYCRKMEAGTFAHPDTVKLLGGRFIPVKLDAARDAAFVRGMGITVFPTTVIAGHDGKVYAFLGGYLDGGPFRENANKALALITPAPVAELAVVAATKPAVTTVAAERQRNDTDALSAATADLDERTATAYLKLADAWAKQGKPTEAAECYAKAARAAPTGKTAGIAQSKLAALGK